MTGIGAGNPRARSPFEAEWQGRFREFAEIRDDDAGIAGWTPTGLKARLRRFLAAWKPGAQGEQWLDAGCGAGSYAQVLLANNMAVVAIDYSLPTLQKARERTAKSIRYAAGDVGRLPFRENTFGGVLCFGVMQALSECGPAIRELASVVKPGGELWIDALNRSCVVHAVESSIRKLRGRRMHLRYDSPEKVKKMMASAGLVQVQLYWMPIFPSRWQRFQSWVESPFVQFMFRRVPALGLLFCHAFIVRGVRATDRPRNSFPCIGVNTRTKYVVSSSSDTRRV